MTDMCLKRWRPRTEMYCQITKYCKAIKILIFTSCKFDQSSVPDEQLRHLRSVFSVAAILRPISAFLFVPVLLVLDVLALTLQLYLKDGDDAVCWACEDCVGAAKKNETLCAGARWHAPQFREFWCCSTLTVEPWGMNSWCTTPWMSKKKSIVRVSLSPDPLPQAWRMWSLQVFRMQLPVIFKNSSCLDLPKKINLKGIFAD